MKKHYRISLNSPVILSFAAAACAALVINTVTFGQANHMYFSVYSSPWSNPMTFVRLFGHVLGHSGVMHLVNNMMYILLVGPTVEDHFGHGATALAIFITAAVTGLAVMLFMPGTALLGASGIVFAMIMMSAAVGFKEGDIPLTFILVAVLYLGQQVYQGMAVSDNISQLTHIIGGVVGMVFAFVYNRKR